MHADLSEFNILLQDGQLVIIDVSQAVEHDHPHSFDFLRKDCTNISEFFRKKAVATMTVKELFDFITDQTITESNMEECLERISERIKDRDFDAITAQEQIDEAVWQNTYIPKRLDEVESNNIILFYFYSKRVAPFRFITSSAMWLRPSKECNKISFTARSPDSNPI